MRTDEVLAQIDGAIDDWEVGPDAVRFNAPVRRPVDFRQLPSPDPEAMARVSVRVNLIVENYRREMAKVGTALLRFVNSSAGLCRLFGFPKTPYDKHHPRPLCIDGRAYHQKRRNRRKP